MTDKRMNGLGPTQLRMILVFGIVTILIASAVGFWFFRGWLESYAAGVSEEAQKAELTSNEVTALQNVQKQLDENRVAVNRAQNIVADSKSYSYQTQIMNDINKYAANSGIVVTGYTFGSDGSTENPNASASPNPDAGAAAAATPAPAGLKTTSVSLTIASPVPYQSIMKFMRAIETNLTKMQLTGISMTQDSENKGDFVSVDPLTIEVYVK